MLSPAQTIEAFKDLLFPVWEQQCHPVMGKVVEIDKWWHGKQSSPDIPNTATREFRELAEESRSPWASLLVKAPTQQLFVEGYRRTEDDGNNAAWKTWQRNGMDARQIQLHASSIAHGAAFLVVLGGSPDPLTKLAYPSMRGYSARRMAALFSDFDDYPMWTIDSSRHSKTETLFRLMDETHIYYVSCSIDDVRSAKFISAAPHGSPCCPVVRYSPNVDLDGRARGDIEIMTPILRRLDRDVFDRIVAQRYASWKVRYATGMVKPENDEERAAIEKMLTMGSILMNESTEGKFGTLDSTDLTQFVSALESDLRTFSAISQIPPAQLLGTITNMSAEGLAAAEAQLMRKVDECKYSFGESHERAMRLVEYRLNPNGNVDDSAQVRWKDVSAKSLAATADALGKLAQMLGVPVELLWERIPGFTQQDIERATELKMSGDALGQLAATLNAQASGDI